MNTDGRFQSSSTNELSHLLYKISAGKVTPTTSATDIPHGVCVNSTIEDQFVELELSGLHQVRAQGAIAAGAEITCSATAGHVSSAASGNRIIGYAPTALADGDIGYVVLFTNKTQIKA